MNGRQPLVLIAPCYGTRFPGPRSAALVPGPALQGLVIIGRLAGTLVPGASKRSGIDMEVIGELSDRQ